MLFDIRQTEWLYLKTFSCNKQRGEPCQVAVRNLFRLFLFIVISIHKAYCLIDHLFVINFQILSRPKDFIYDHSAFQSSDFGLVVQQTVVPVEFLSRNEVHHVLNGVRVKIGSIKLVDETILSDHLSRCIFLSEVESPSCLIF
jgi:hypothetical protein